MGKEHVFDSYVRSAEISGTVLLGMKKRGFGVGKWNGFGGKVEVDESIEHGAIRELEEECGIMVTRDELRDLGYVIYIDSHNIRLVHIFTATKEPEMYWESEEMLPRWFTFEEIPYEDMWPDAIYWLPRVLSDSSLRAYFIYGGNGKIIHKQIDEIYH